jgi:hypothetical protein
MCAAREAGSPPRSAPADYATPESSAAPGAQPDSNDTTQREQRQFAPPPAPSTPPDAPREVQRAIARAELERATLELQASANDCAQACRALASMERATAHLCALADQSDDQRRCDDATRRLREARDRVRVSCGSCPGGPSVDPGAPVPAFP